MRDTSEGGRMRLAPEQLSERRKRILDGIVEGKSNPVLAEELGLTLDGIKWHVSEMLGELNLSSRQELAAWWRDERRKSVPVATPLGYVRAALQWGTRVALAGAITGAAVFGIWCAASNKRASSEPATADDGTVAIVYAQVRRVKKSATPTIADLTSNIYLVRAGERPTLLAEFPGAAISYVQVSPDGRHIAAWGTDSLLILDRQGRQVMKESTSHLIFGGSWSRDSRVYAWSDLSTQSGPPQYGSIRIVDVLQRQELLTFSGLDLSYPSWAGNSGGGLFASQRRGEEQLPAHLVEAAPSASTDTLPIADVAGAPFSSPDGSRIALWIDDQGEVTAGATDGSAGTLTILPASGRQPRVVVPALFPSTGAWLRGGSEFLAACVDSRSETPGAAPSSDLCLIDPTGQRSQPEMLTHDGQSADPAFSPDGSQIAYLSHRASIGLYTLKVLDRATGRSQTLASNLGLGSFSWLPTAGGS